MAAAAMLAATVGCKENDIALYNESPRLEYATIATCTFNDQDYLNAYILDEKTTEKECEITVQLIGRLLTEPMTYCMKGVADPKSEFEVQARFENPYTFPSSAATTEAKVYVTCPTREQASIKDVTTTGTLEISSDTQDPNHSFGPGRNENLVCRLNVVLQIYPDNWDSNCWGAYSRAKYIFMMESFKTTHNNIEKTQENRIELRRLYNTYKEEHDTALYDDDGNEINFPVNPPIN